MNHVQVELTERQSEVLDEIAQRLGRSREDLLQSAVKQVISSYEQESRCESMRRARGIWSSRQLPYISVRNDRGFKDRYAVSSEEKI